MWLRVTVTSGTGTESMKKRCTVELSVRELVDSLRRDGTHLALTKVQSSSNILPQNRQIHSPPFILNSFLSGA